MKKSYLCSRNPLLPMATDSNISLMNEATWRYVRMHANDDVRQLALRGTKDAEVDLPMALQQLQGWQTARRKLPSWAAIEGLVYPSHLSMEQCSSEQTARYKAAIAGSLKGKERLVDLTGGFGVDFAFMSEGYAEAVYVEQQPRLYAIASTNFKTIRAASHAEGLARLATVNADGVDFLHTLDHASLIFLDPARRDGHGGRTYGISDCTPNVLPLMDELLAKGDHVMLKLSPMLDWRKALADIGASHVEQVHIVAVGGECKELLMVLSAQGCEEPQLFCVNDDSIETFPLLPSPFTNHPSPFTNHPSPFTNHPSPITLHPSPLTNHPSPLTYLYEPNAALMKAGVFGELAQRYGVKPLATNSHLFTSAERVERFPGRVFQISAISSMNKQELKANIMPLHQANISVRNFPLSVAELRKRLKLSEGGSNYLFATTLANGDHILIVGRKPTP